MTSPSSAKALSDFIDAWNAGRRPRVDDYLDRVPEPERDELADQLGLWLELAPTPDFSAAQREAIRAEPVVARVQAAVDSDAGLLALELPRLRARRSLSVRDVASALVAGLALAPGDVDRTEDYLQRVESGSHDATKLSRRLLDALAGALGASTESLRNAATLSGAAFRPSTAGGTLFRADPDAGQWVEADLEALTMAAMAPAPETQDEVDRLFCGGWEA